MPSVLTPFDLAAATKVGPSRWRKEVLRVGTINYRGQKLALTGDKLRAMADAFNKRAYDQVPFVLADPDNKHNSDPERFRGEIEALDYSDGRLYATLQPSEKGQQLLADNPRLGVSARINFDHVRSDGAKFDAAIEHICGTLNPVITGMKPWEQVNLSTDTDDVFDLSMEDFVPDMPEQMDLSDEEFVAAVESIDDEQQPNQPAGDQPDEENDDETSTDDDGGENTDGDDTGGDDEQQGAPVPEQNDNAGADLSVTADITQVDLAAKVADLESKLANADADKEATDYLNAGVPAVMVNLARPALTSPGGTIDLTNTDGTTGQTDHRAVIRALLDEAKGTVNLSREAGHHVVGKVQEDQLQAMADEWREGITR